MPPTRLLSAWLLLATLGIAPAVCADNAPDATPNALPTALKDVGIDQKLGQQVPADLVFRDEQGRPVRLGDYFGNKPIVLTLVYFRCPMLCTLVLNDLTRSLNVMSLTAGKDFQIITVSFDPRETADLAAAKKKEYLHQYQRPQAAAGWHFLTGDQASIAKLTSAVGFRYVYDQKYQQYIHASGIMVLTPHGTISRYFFGIDYAPKDLDLSLVEASSSTVGSLTDQILLYCFHYDPSLGRYSFAVLKLLRVVGVVTILALGTFMVVMFRRERKTAAAPGGRRS